MLKLDIPEHIEHQRCANHSPRAEHGVYNVPYLHSPKGAKSLILYKTFIIIDIIFC